MGTTFYVLLPILMMVGTLVLRPAVSRVANITLSLLYAVTILAGELGEEAARSAYSVDREFDYGLELILDALERGVASTSADVPRS